MNFCEVMSRYIQELERAIRLKYAIKFIQLLKINKTKMRHSKFLLI